MILGVRRESGARKAPFIRSADASATASITSFPPSLDISATTPSAAQALVRFIREMHQTASSFKSAADIF
eukprot:7334303-Pyramimonas_sp.AAC.1